MFQNGTYDIYIQSATIFDKFQIKSCKLSLQKL